MSVEQNEENNKEVIEGKPAVQAPNFDRDELIAAAKAAIQKDLPKSVTTEDITRQVEAATAAQNQRLAEALGVAPRKDQVNPLTRSLLTDPEGTLKAFRDVLKEEYREEQAQEKAIAAAERAEEARLYKERPDIMQDDNTLSIFNDFYASSNQDTVKKRVEEAQRKTDLLLEKAGRGTAAERIAAASSAPSGGGSKEPNKQEKPGSPEDLPQKYVDERLARRKAQLAV